MPLNHKKDHRHLAQEAMAFVLAGGRGSRLLELTDVRAKPAVYFGGKTRIIDFALSNALNSGIRRIGVATQYKAHSLIQATSHKHGLFYAKSTTRALIFYPPVSASMRTRGTKARPMRSIKTLTSSRATRPSTS